MILSVQIRNYKIYNKNTFIRLSADGSAFSAIIGKNGVGKSTILEALDTVFNNKQWKLSSSSSKSRNESSYVSILYEMTDEILSVVDREVAGAVSNVLKRMPRNFSAQKSTTNEAAVKLRSFLENSDLPEFIGIIGKSYEAKVGRKFYAGDLVHDFLIGGLELELGVSRDEAENLFGSYCRSCLDACSYTYISVEDGVPELLKVEKQLMERILPQDIMSGIIDILDEKRITVHNNRRGKNPRKSTVGLINDGLNDISKRMSQTVKRVDDSYSYKHISSSRNLTSRDLADAIINSFFSSRSFVKDGIPVENLSSGEKRMALLDIVFSFLRELEIDKFTILAIDEPESSLHVSSSFDQFRKLIRIAEDANCQVFCTSHWYGFIPIIRNGSIVHIDAGLISFFKNEDFIPGNSKVPTDVLLKSGFELAGSIINSIKSEPVTWIVCEGGTDKKYLEAFLGSVKTYRVVAASNDITVMNLYKQLSMSLKGVNRHQFSGEVICLIDTDSDTAGKIQDLTGFSDIEGVLKFRRLNLINGEMRLSDLGERRFNNCSIEDFLHSETVARIASRRLEISFERSGGKALKINCHTPSVKVEGGEMGDFEAIRFLRNFIFSESADKREIAKAKGGFCDEYIAEVSEEECQDTLELWQSLAHSQA